MLRDLRRSSCHCAFLLLPPLLLSLGSSLSMAAPADDAAEVYEVGVAREDITPDYPIRLNGFGFRREESEGVSQRIWAKALAIGSDEEGPAILITLDSLGVRKSLVDEVADRLRKRHNIARERIALTFSHSHCTPKVNGACDNIFSQPIPQEHQRHIDRYTRELTDKVEAVAVEALRNRRASTLAWAVGEVGFAKNRRTAGGPVDHDLPMLVVRDPQGKVRAVYVSYACHCVTLSFNQISGDWAGHAQELIERKFPGTTGLVSIGCGSDSNPLSGVTGDKVDVAATQGAMIADEVARLMAGELRPLKGKLHAQLQTIPLPLNKPPSADELRALAERGGPAGYNASTQLARLERGEPLLTAIDYPIQTWTFGDRLAMVFLAGEVCVDYSLRLKEELDKQRLWINAYSNDFCSYIPSERLAREGGYGGGAEIPYFALPSTLQAGLEDRIVDEVTRQLQPFVSGGGTQGVAPQSPEASRQSLRTHPRFEVELVASEPLLDDPVAIDFGPDGRLWVAEMPDYTQATEAEFEQHGRVKFLRDADGDGRLDTATVFLEGLRFPTDVKVWRDGVLVCDAPDILWAADTDGDGRADQKKTLFTGFATHNPHARVNSLRLGLDNWLYGSGGLFGGQITSFTGRTADVSGRDFRIRPDTGEIEPVTGRTQQGRVRDDAGNWFGCDNGTILRQYPLVDHYLRRNPHVAPPASAVFVPDYPAPGRVLPTGELVRFKLSGPPGKPTSVCGLGIYRDSWLGGDLAGNSFVCEPVNQLVHRLVLREEGTTIRGSRSQEEQDREFLTSTDRWFRPVQVRTGPDGALWIVDMYRYVIEHPRWIPEETVRQLDTFAGTGMGRIYRVRPREKSAGALPQLHTLGGPELAERLDNSNGTVRDMVQQLLVGRGDVSEGTVAKLKLIAVRGKHPYGRLQALATLDGMDKLDQQVLLAALGDEHAGVRRHAIRMAEASAKRDEGLRDAVLQRVDDPSALVRQQLAYSLGELPGKEAASALARLIVESEGDAYLRAAALSSLHAKNVAEVLPIVAKFQSENPQADLLAPILVTATKTADRRVWIQMLKTILPAEDQPLRPWQFHALQPVLDAAATGGDEVAMSGEFRGLMTKVMDEARRVAADEAAEMAARLDAVQLLARGAERERGQLQRLLEPRHPLALQQAAVEALGRHAGEEAAGMLLAAWDVSGPALRSSILDTLLSRKAGAERLLAALESGRLPPSQLDAARRSQLSERLGAAYAERLAKALQLVASRDRAAVLEHFAAALELPGDPAAGRTVFNKVCADCHRLENQGHAVGPDLAALTNKTAESLLTATLDPSRDVDARYLNYVVADANGRVISGILAEETGTSITLAEPAGKRQVILRRDVDELRATGKSFMPEGLEKDLTPQDLANLLRYIIELPKGQP